MAVENRETLPVVVFLHGHCGQNPALIIIIIIGLLKMYKHGSQKAELRMHVYKE